MRKSPIIIAGFATIALAFASCSKEQKSPDQSADVKQVTLTFKAGSDLEHNSTKTHLVSENGSYKVYWDEEGEAIKVFQTATSGETSTTDQETSSECLADEQTAFFP